MPARPPSLPCPNPAAGGPNLLALTLLFAASIALTMGHNNCDHGSRFSESADNRRWLIDAPGQRDYTGNCVTPLRSTVKPFRGLSGLLLNSRSLVPMEHNYIRAAMRFPFGKW